jgi:hypothetical protein
VNEVLEGEIVDASTGELIVPPAAAILSADPTAVVEAFAKYKAIQNALDRAMPDCIMNIRGKQFRKKMYWRAIATAFNLSLEMVREDRTEDGDDWGWLVTYRATAPSGRHADGDGSCFASEKSSGQDSVHNVRAHAHTRAKNRAVADLVGFGEVSAEEMNPRESYQDRDEAPPNRGGRAGGWRDAMGAAPLEPGGMMPEEAVRRVRDGAPPQRRTQAPPPPRDESADPAAQAFLYQPGDAPPPEPKYRQWRGDAPTKNPASEFAKHTWSHMEVGSYGGKRYQWCRRVLAMPDPPASTAERARFCVFVIENREHNKRADMAAAKGEETPF